MFTGIIETVGKVEKVTVSGTNKTFWISSDLSNELKPDQSLSHNGVCLTVEKTKGILYQVTAIEETLLKSNLGSLQAGDEVNLERCMLMNGRLDGHIVQGHVDCTADCLYVNELDGSWEYRFRFPEQFGSLIIEKGSVALNGISLTVFSVTKDEFSVAIIPYTYEHTNMKNLESGQRVNIEFDILGKYVQRMLDLRKNN